MRERPAENRALSGNSQRATVSVPAAPKTRYGYIRVVARGEVEVTGLTSKEWQLYQLTFGSSIRQRLRGDLDDK